ncbi:hypothetical protein [uncultured Streptomyces sp.]|uniref:hypothetical protein n=1 Tax=uncultured Streptomyces sp. TaxID=174707 RepID=UPI002631AE22|nr:hypothetical protein [uncultured Streptomyces sp.]
MTDSPQDTTRQARRTLITLLVVTAVLLVPLFLGFWHSAEEAVRNKSDTDWRGNHETKLAFQRAALVIFGLPSAGAACGFVVASLRDRPAALPVVRGLLVSTVLAWFVLAGSVFAAFMRSPLL